MRKRKRKMGMFEEVYKLVRKIPEGKVTTYGEIARFLKLKDVRKVEWSCTKLTSSCGLRLRSRRALMRGKANPRIVGFALHANKDPDVPCHRVVNKKGRLAPNFAFDGWREQKRRLDAEKVDFVDEMHVNLEKHLWQM